jgi:hypothetical protein
MAFAATASVSLRPLWIAAVAIALLGSAPAKADVVISIQSPLNANAGDTGDSFDVTLTNTGPSAVSIAAFTFEISAANTDMTFTDANTGTGLAPYIFAGNSLFGPDITVSNTGPGPECQRYFRPSGIECDVRRSRI